MKDDIFNLCDIVRECSFSLHKHLRHGHLEKVYENGLAHRLAKLGINLQQQVPLIVRDVDGTILGDFYADLHVEDKLIIELKACACLVDSHIAQLLGYLRATGIEHGLLINFGAERLEIRKFALSNIDQYAS